MADDLYAPPNANLVEPGSRAATGSFDVSQCLNEGWEVTRNHFGIWLVACLVAGLVGGVAALTIIGIPLVLPVLIWGLTKLYLNMYDDEPGVRDVFSGFANYGHALVGMAGMLMCTWLFSFAGQSVQLVGEIGEINALMVVGVGVNLAWSFVVMPRFHFASYFLVDQDMGPIESLQASWDATRGQVAKLVVLLIASSCVIFAGLLCFIVGVIPATAVVAGMWVSAYRQTVGGVRSVAA